jgi:uncharacterized repeat protein (TIGR03803 family)
LSPPSGSGSSWTETVLWNFGGNVNGDDGALPFAGLTWDSAGNLYGTTAYGGSSISLGTIFELSPSSGGGWSEKVLYRFCVDGPPCLDGAGPLSGVTFDESGNLYGTNSWPAGTIFELSPQPDGAWIETTVHRFSKEGENTPISEVNMDQAGNLYGTVSDAGYPTGCGGVWKLAPQSNGSYSAAVLPFNRSGVSGCNPMSGVFLDRKANVLYGTAANGGAGSRGVLYKINAGGKQTVLYNFCQQSGCADGSTPEGSFTQYGGALFSTTSAGGSFNQGVVFTFTP